MLRVQQEYTVYAVTIVYYERIVKTWSEYSHKECDATVRAVLMGTKSCPKILNFSTRFSCENLDVEDFVTLLMGKKSC